MKLKRFRVRAGNKKFTDRGPDLLRDFGNARKALRGLLGPGATSRPLATRIDRPAGTSDWKPAESRLKIIDRLTLWATDPVGDFQVGRVQQDGTGYDIVAAVGYKEVPVRELAHCTAATNAVISLIEYQFPTIRFAGGFVYKQVSGSDEWSDHAWGTAGDESENPPAVTNDEVTDWLSRMGKAGCIDFDYALGSRDDKVVQVTAPDFEIEPSGASSTHLWHVHISVVDHDGAKPTRNPMVP